MAGTEVVGAGLSNVRTARLATKQQEWGCRGPTLVVISKSINSEECFIALLAFVGNIKGNIHVFVLFETENSFKTRLHHFP